MTENPVATLYNADVAAAWSLSILGDFDAALQTSLLTGSALQQVHAGDAISDAVHGEGRLAVIVTGIVRAITSSSEGRRATLRYARSGDLTGVIALLTPRQAIIAEAVIDCEVLYLDLTHVTQLAMSHSQLSWRMAQEAARVCSEIIDIAATNVFGTVRQRVAWHLLDLSEAGAGGLVVSADQQDIADSVGSVREVVARAIRSLRDEGIITRADAGIVISEPEALQSVAMGK